MSENERATGEPVGIRQVTRVWWHKSHFCRSGTYVFCSAPEEEQTISCLCFAKKAEEDITVLMTAINLEIIVSYEMDMQ